MDACSGTYIDDDVAGGGVGDEAANGNGGRRSGYAELRRIGFKGRSQLGDGLFDGFIEDGLAEVGAAHVEMAGAVGPTGASAAKQVGAGAGGLAGAADRGEDLAGIDVDHARGDSDDGFRFVQADSSQAIL